MGLNVAQKIINSHILSDKSLEDGEIAIAIDQTLTQDSTGTMAYLQFEAMNIPRVRTKLSVSYVDHNMLQTGFEHSDDHLYLQTVAEKYGIVFSRPGNGICHQVHLERFAVPGTTLLGSDSHTPTNGAIGALAIGAGGLEVALAMAGGFYHFTKPHVIKVNLTGELPQWVTAKDIILEFLRLMTIKGGLNKIIEYGGEGIKSLSVPERATITNMGTELGAITSIFPSDEVTLEFLKTQNREADWTELKPDPDASYEKIININLNELEPLVAQPDMPDNVCKVSKLSHLKVNQVAIGSCTNSSYTDLMKVAEILKGQTIHPEVSLVISPGSRQVFNMLIKNGALGDLVEAGARILECSCGPCIGMGQAPPSKGVSVRTFNRNFKGRSGTKDALVYLTSPEVAAVTAIKGYLSDPRGWGEPKNIMVPKEFFIDDNMLIWPPEDGASIKIRRGPNIQPIPLYSKATPIIEGHVLIKASDHITTDDISPAGAKYLPYRSNIPALAEHIFEIYEPQFIKRAKKFTTGIIVAGINYGQGSSREHAALCTRYLGVRAVIAKSFARIHFNNLLNAGIMPLVFTAAEDYDKINLEDLLSIDLNNSQGKNELVVKNHTKELHFIVSSNLSPRQQEIILAGGLLNLISSTGTREFGIEITLGRRRFGYEGALLEY